MTRGRSLELGALLLVAAVYAAVAALSPGFDDEFFDVRAHMAASGGGLGALFEAASQDPVHPTGSYLLTLALREALGSWPAVRVARSLAFVALGWALLRRLVPGGGGAAVAALVLLSPSLVLWCTGLRWFAEFTALLLAALALDRLVPPAGRAFLPALAGIVVALVHVNYLGLALAPALLAGQLIGRPRPAPGPAVLAAAILALGCAAPARAALEVADWGQRGSLLQSVVGTGHGLLVNHGVFPLSAAGLAALASAAALFGGVLALRPRAVLGTRLGLTVLGLVAALALSGLGLKFRNAAPLVPAVLAVALPLALAARGGAGWLRAAAAGVILTNLWGLLNVVGHRDTAKGSWNLPVATTLAEVRRLAQGCDRPLLVVWDPVLQFHLWQAGYDTADLAFRGGPSLPRGAAARVSCVLVVATNPGSSAGALWFQAPPPGLRPLVHIRADPHHAVKAARDPGIPGHYVTILSLAPSEAARHRRLLAESFYDATGPRDDEGGATPRPRPP